MQVEKGTAGPGLRPHSGRVPGAGRLLPLLVATALLAIPARRAAAEDVDAIVRHGLELRRQGHDDEALAEFQRALKIQKAPRVQAQVALAEQALGLWAPAEEDLSAALADSGDSWIKKNRGALEKALTTIQGHLGTLAIWGTPAGATVYINEKPVGKLPLAKPVRVSGESVVLRAQAEGYLDAPSHAVRVPAGFTTREHLELVPVGTVAVGDKPKGEGAVAVATSTTRAEPSGSTGLTRLSSASDQPSDSARPANKLRALAWITGVAAVAGLVLGVVETVASVHNRDAFNNYAQPNPADPAHPIMDYCATTSLPAECKPLQDAYNRSRTLMFVGYAAAGALAVGSTVLFVVSSRGDSGSTTALACSPGPSGRSLSCFFRF